MAYFILLFFIDLTFSMNKMSVLSHVNQHEITALLPSKHTQLLADNISNPEIYITSYGGDPTGIKDSTTAFQDALNEAMTRGIPGAVLDGSIKDCGGVTVNLQGGIYLISRPLWTTSNHGNFRIIDGTIKASSTFSNSSTFLLSIWGSTQDIAFENLFFDGSNKVDGCLLIENCVGAVVGPQDFFLGFNLVGIKVEQGHEVIIYNTWVGEYVWNDPRRNTATATGIQLYGNDHYISDVIIWSGKIGLQITGGANIIYGLHTYNLATEYGGIGILGETDSLRIIGCYLDYNNLVLMSPINLVSIQDTFFLGGTNIVLKANNKNSTIQSLSIRDSQYSRGSNTNISDTIVLDESNGIFASIKDVYIDDAIIGGYNYGGYQIKTTKYTKKLSLKNTTEWIFDFSDVLLFDTSRIYIEFVDYTFQLDSTDSNFDYKHLLLKPIGSKVTVQTNMPCDATVYMTVDQSNH